MEKLNNAGKIIMTPCKNLPGSRSICYDDRFVLTAAELNDGAIISNDNFVDLLQQKESKCPKSSIVEISNELIACFIDTIILFFPSFAFHSMG